MAIHTWCTCKTSNAWEHRINRLSRFCGHRWCENEECAEKSKFLIKGYQKFLTHVSTLKKKQQPDSKKNNFIVLKKMIHDPLISAKLRFFKMVSRKLNAFLRGFQTDSPMVSFFADVLGRIVHVCWKELSSSMC